MDAGYAKQPAFLRALDDGREVFVADVQRTQRVWLEQPALAVPQPTEGPRSTDHERVASPPSVTVENPAAGLSAADWQRCGLRDGTRGEVRVDIAQRRVWVWNGEEDPPRCWHLIVGREVGSPKTVKYSLCNAPAGTPVQRLAQMQGQRYWVERAFEDAKSACGLADYEALLAIIGITM